METEAASVVGIDLSGRAPSAPRHTAVAWLTLESAPRLLQLRPDSAGRRTFIGEKGDEALRSALRELRPSAIAIDAPLTLPHAVECDELDCSRCLPTDGSPAASYTRRDVETRVATTEVQRWEWSPRPPMTTAQLAALAFRARWLSRAFQQDGLPAAIETYPAAVYRRLASDTPLSSREKLVAGDRFWLLKERTPVEGLDDFDATADAADDQLDAIAAAYVAWCHHEKRADPVQAVEGTIWLPAS